jgi:hypothetical protein
MNLLLSIVILSASVLAVFAGRLILFTAILPILAFFLFLHNPYTPKTFTYWSLSILSGIFENGERMRRHSTVKVMQKSEEKY